MISGLSKAITLYLAPLLMLTALLLSIFAFLAPVVLLHHQVYLLSVTPTSSSSGEATDGPSVFLGLLGSCSRLQNTAPTNCTNSTLIPTYDLHVLPGNAPVLLSPPGVSISVAIAIAEALSLFFLIAFISTFFHHKLGSNFGGIFTKPATHRLTALIGFFGFLIGITSFLIARIWFEKAAQDFNNIVSTEGQTKFVASMGNAFTMAWVAYAFFAVPVIISLAKINVKATK